MNKTLPKQFTVDQSQKPAEIVKKESDSEALVNLMQEMKSVWQDAASDLLKPRSEAVAAILKKVVTPAQ